MSDRFTEAAYGTTAMYALALLVLSGIVGRLLDVWQARVIAVEAGSNHVGIAGAVAQQMTELELTLERLQAGKSEQFRQACAVALRSGGRLDTLLPLPLPAEAEDAWRAKGVLEEYAGLQQSHQRQQRAQSIMKVWRAIHIPLAIAAVGVISYHAVSELLMAFVLHP
jgi:hypothetical protein